MSGSVSGVWVGVFWACKSHWAVSYKAVRGAVRGCYWECKVQWCH